MRVVSNTSPISNLAIVGRLEILRHQLGNLLIPPAVRAELSRLDHPGGRRAVEQAFADGWIRIEAIRDAGLFKTLVASLDAGEAEAICLASNQEGSLLVMDESAGRSAARNLEIRVTGTLGVLLKERHRGGIDSIRDEMDRLVNEAGFFVSKQIRETVLKAAGEA